MDDAAAVDEALGRLLVERGRLDPAGLGRAQRVREASHEPLHLLLPKLGLVSERDVAETLAQLLDLPLAGEADYPDLPLHGERISVNFLKEARILPLAETEDGLTVAMADPLDRYTIGAMQLFAGKPVLPWVGVPADIEAALERLFGRSGTIGEIIQPAGEQDELGAEDDVQRLRDLASEAPVVRIVNRLITRAVESRASDIHIEPLEQNLRVRYRIDGVLREVETPPLQLRAAIISRDQDHGAPQHRRAPPAAGRPDQARRARQGHRPARRHHADHARRGGGAAHPRSGQRRARFHRAWLRRRRARPPIARRSAGPTASSWSPARRAAARPPRSTPRLIELNTPDRKVLAVEDPIEYQLDGVNQVQIKPQIGLSFAHVLRSMLRHDPDVIMVGEIRDLETAQIAIQAALTGHLVLSTLHTNNAASTLTRLLDMGVDDYLMTSTLNAIVAQRLVRCLCQDCREALPAAARAARPARPRRP